MNVVFIRIHVCNVYLSVLKFFTYLITLFYLFSIILKCIYNFWVISKELIKKAKKWCNPSTLEVYKRVTNS